MELSMSLSIKGLFSLNGQIKGSDAIAPVAPVLTPTGSLLWILDNPNAYGNSGSDNFGFSVSISGNYAIVGAWLEDDAGGNESGKAYIFN